MKFYHNDNLKWWAVSYEKDPTYVYVFLKGETPSNTLLEAREVEALLGHKWEEVTFSLGKPFTDCTLEDEEKEKSQEFFTVLEYEYDGLIWFYDHDDHNPNQYSATLWVTAESCRTLVEISPADFKDRKITKVRRESDGEVFSVGDVVFTVRFQGWNIFFEVHSEPYEITSLNFYTYRKGIYCTYKNQQYVSGFFLNNDIKKAYKVEDGYVCEGDTVWSYSAGIFGEIYHHQHTFLKPTHKELRPVYYKNRENMPPAQKQESQSTPPRREFNTTKEAELLAEMENKNDELLQKLMQIHNIASDTLKEEL